MSANRRAAERLDKRRANRLQNASLYAASRRTAQAQAQAPEVKPALTISTLLSYLNPFKRRSEPPRSLPQILQDDYPSSRSGDDGSGNLTEEEGGAEFQMIGETVTSTRPSAASNSSANRHQSPLKSLPFSIAPTSSPIKPSQQQGLFATPGRQNGSPSIHTPSANESPRRGSDPHISPSGLKPIADFLDERARAGGGLSNSELQQLSGMLASQAVISDDDNLPSAAFLGVGHVSRPSRSYLSPQPREIRGFDAPPVSFTSGSRLPSSQSARTALSKSAFDTRSAIKPVRASSLTKSWTLSRNVREPRHTQSITRTDTVEDVTLMGVADGSSGKRRRTDLEQETIVELADPLPGLPPASVQPDPIPQSQTRQPSKLTTSFKFGAGNGLRKPLTNPTPSPAIPSPLRFVTQAAESPSPPRQSQTAAAVMDIINDANKDLGIAEIRSEIEQAVVNPFEKKGPKVPVKRKAPLRKEPPKPPKKNEEKPPELPSSAQAIAASLPTPKKPSPSSSIPVKSNPPTSRSFEKQSVRHGGQSPFLPPPKAPPAASQRKINGTNNGPYTVDDIDDDEIMEIEEIPKSKAGSTPFRKASPPPIVVEELIDEDMEPSASSDPPQRPTLITEPSEPKRMGRSPSLGPNPYTFSPSIPSPLRLVSMPEEDELEDDVQPATQPALPNASAPLPTLFDTQQAALDLPSSALPKYRMDVNFIATIITNPAAAAEAMALPIDRLPKYDLTEAPRPQPATAAVPIAFNWSAAGFKPPAAAAGTWKCPVCMLSNPISAPKCGVCDAAKPEDKRPGPPFAPPSAPSTASPAFNWSQAGFVPQEAATGSWTCESCGLINPATAVGKCEICKTAIEQPSAKQDIAKPSISQEVPRSFNWAAAGIVPPTTAPGTWSCSVCGLSNPATVNKCTVCDNAR